MTQATGHSNALIHEASPYLQQHAHNPVDWHPWGEEAFALARLQNRPVLLSIGYSTCHWCHVMEEESFADVAVAEVLNRNFVCIKVDREERPDIDALYMQAAQRLNGSGGWPLNVLLTPEKQPFYAFTYLPKEDRFGRMGLMTLADRIGELWRNDRQKIERAAATLTASLRGQGHPAGRGHADRAWVDAGFAALRERFDRDWGGFGDAPKFPSPHKLMFLLRYAVLQQQPEGIEMVVQTLQKMRLGGIHDHLGGGFHRYATDREWRLPHFEKMLYDQALLLMSYAEAWQLTQQPELRQTGLDIATYLLRDMHHEKGGFFTAEDADSEGEEGTFYVWREAEVRALFGKQAEALLQAFDIRAQGNYRDEATRSYTGASVLYLQQPARLAALDWPELRARWREARERRPRPFRDEKILADWNGLAIAALAGAGRIFGQPELIDAAAAAARFVLHEMQHEGHLLHCWYRGEAAVGGKLDDYAFMVWGLLELYESTLDAHWLEQAQRLNTRMLHDFAAADGGFYLTSEHDGLIARPMERFDGALPSGNAVAMHNLLRLARLTADSSVEQQAADVMARFAVEARQVPEGMLHMLSALLLAETPAREIVLAGPLDQGNGPAILALIRQHFRPNTVVLRRDAERIPFTRPYRPLHDKATAYICENFQCHEPTTEVRKVRQLLGPR